MGGSTMQVTVTGRNIELTPALKDYLTDKLQRSQKHFDHDLAAIALLSVAKNPSVSHSQTAEVTIKLNGSLIRGEESTENMYASIDLVADKIERQLRKYKTRYYQKGNKVKGRNGSEVIDVGAQIDYDNVISQEIAAESFMPKIVRSKRFTLKPMPADEACKQMDLL